jgi:hypothetical protein
MSGVCRGCLHRQLRLQCVLRRGYAAAAPSAARPNSVPPRPPPDPSREQRNAHSLRYKIDLILTMKNPERAEETLQQSRMPDAVYAWNLLVKYHAHEGKYSETERVYQQVLPPDLPHGQSISLTLVVDEKVRCKTNCGYLCSNGPCY